MMPKFIKDHVDPGTRLGEILFGLIMALGFTAAVRFGVEEATNRELFIAILGCNIAWGIVDGVMYVIGELFERGRKARVVRKALHAANQDEAIEHIGSELDERFAAYISPEERRGVYAVVLQIIKRGGIDTSRFGVHDLLAALGVSIVIIVSTLPVVIPFLVIQDTYFAVRCSNIVGVSMLFALGCWWGRIVEVSAIKLGAGLALIGIVLVGVTIALGG